MAKKNILKKLEDEVTLARRRVKTDMLSMSIGEIVNKISDKELILRPKFQRYFRWGDEQKSNLIESVLINLPIPSIFVSTNNDGKWEVIDGLQRLNTIYSFVENAFELDECTYIKSFKGMKYNDFSDKLKLIFRNKRFDFIILDEASDVNAKYDMFSRLNTGGSCLSYQEVRNCMMIMKNEDFYDWFDSLKNNIHFKNIVTDQFSDRYRDQQKDLEMVLKFLAIRNTIGSTFDFVSSNSFLDSQAMIMCADKEYDREKNKKAFEETFKLLDDALGQGAFKKYDVNSNQFNGPINFSIYEILIAGIGKNILAWSKAQKTIIKESLKDKLIKMYSSKEFEQISKIGTTVSKRLKNAINYADKVFDSDGIKL